ncbi:hypothetical protein ACFP81_04565 [Deinococcus lacus]|uniref:Phosphoribosyl-ATP pyrophosphohydrolase n=1 Tax=Deinococcus lacus TaxID=392561 RepID=A0ABW1YAW7_9DEIO
MTAEMPADPSASVPKSNAQRLREFHRAIGEALPLRPTLPGLDRLAMRRTLIAEEWGEVGEELDLLEARLRSGEATDPAAELTRLAHELTDLLYVTYGTLDLLGIDADAVFAEVHRANLTKAGGPRRADGKQLKPEGWKAADVAGVIRQQAAGQAGRG